MFQVPDDSHVDLRQWLNNGVFCDESGTAYYFEGTTAGRDAAVGLPIPAVPQPSAAPAQTLRRSEVYLHWPLCGAVNNQQYKFAMVVRRLPRRQYARTFCFNQVEVALPRGYEVLAATGKTRTPHSSDIDVIRSLFYPWYPDTLEEANRLLADGWASIALSRRITLVRSEGKQLVFDGMTHAGHIVDDRYLPSVPHYHAMKVLKAFKGELQL